MINLLKVPHLYQVQRTLRLVKPTYILGANTKTTQFNSYCPYRMFSTEPKSKVAP